MAITDNRRGVRIGLGRRINYPTQLPNLATWYTVNDVSSMLNNAGTTPVSGDTIKLIADKSGNSSTNVLCLNGVAGNYASAPDSAAVSITGDIDLRAYVAMNDWTPSATSSLVTKRASAQESYFLGVLASGALRFIYSTDGSALVSRDSTVAVDAADFSALWVRATFDVDNGAAGNTITFYTSTDGSNWVQLGAAVTNAGTVTIFDGTAPVEIGSHTGGTGNLTSGLIYRAQIYNGIGGTLVFDANFATASKLATGFTESSSNAATVTINTSGATGARICGERDAYQGTVSSQPTLLTHSGTNYGYLNATAGNYFSSPDSAALDCSTAVALVFDGAINNWSVTNTTLVCKADNFSTQLSYSLELNAGTLYLRGSTDGTYNVGAFAVSSTVAVTTIAVNRTRICVGATWSANVAKFYTAPAGTTTAPGRSEWTQLGANVTATLAGNLFNSTSEIRAGERISGLTLNMDGLLYGARVYSAVDGTGLVWNLNPATYVSGKTFLDSSSNAATITLNGGTTIVTRSCLYFDGSNDYLKTAAFSLSQPTTVFFVGSQVTWTSADILFDGSSATSKLTQDTFFGTSPNLAITAGGAGGAQTNALAISTNGIISSEFNGTSSFIRINRLSPSSGATVGTNAFNGFTLGANFSGGVPSNITFSEGIIYSAAQDQNTQNLIIGYLGMVWKILLG